MDKQILGKLMGVPKEIKKVLVIRFGAIGDVVHTSIIWNAIKSQHPEVEIHFMSASFIVPIIKRDEKLSKIYSFDMSKKDDLAYLIKLGLELKKEKYDCVISLQNSFRNRLLGLFAGGKYVRRAKGKFEHATDAFFMSAKEVLPDLKKPSELKLCLDENKRNSFSQELSKYPKPHIFISPAGENDKFRQGRIWRFERWNELGERLKKNFGGTVFIVGSKEEAKVHKEKIKIENAVILSGEYSLEDSVHIFSLADVFISGDSGPLHIASALGVKTVGIYGSTSEVFCAPYGGLGYTVRTDFECRACDKKFCKYLKEGEKYTPCIDAVSVDKIFNLICRKNLL